MLAWQDYQRDICNGCGHLLSVSTKTEHQFAYGGEVIRCFACASRQREAKKFADDGGETAGIMVRMTTYPDE